MSKKCLIDKSQYIKLIYDGNDIMQNIKVFIACGGTLVALALIITSLLALIGLEDKIEMFFYLHFTVGAVVVFLVFWPFYSKRMK